MRAGRPNTYKNPKRLSGWLEGDTYEALEQIRWREHKSFNAIINKALAEYVQAHSEGNDTFKLDQWQEDPDFHAVPTILAPTQKWYSYLNDCDKDDLTKIAISAKNILKQIEYYRSK